MGHDPPADRDERLALLLDKTAQRQKAGEAVDWQALRQEHPDLADELRQLLAVGDVMHVCGGTPATISQSAAAPAQSTPIKLPAVFGDFELQEELGRGG